MVERYDKAQQMPDDSYGGSQAPYKYQAKQHNFQNTGRPVRIDGRMEEVVEVSGVQRVQEIEKAKMKKDEKTIHSEAQRQQQESDQEISESGHEVAKVKIHPSDVDPIIRERALTSQY
uniref:Uncharacterized protein n=1 Tax=Magallana gigas TaxID=29159 RepID=K1R0L8_MAGGI